MWEGNIKMNLQEVGCEDVDWIHLAQISSGGCTEHDRESWMWGNFMVSENLIPCLFGSN